MKQSDGLTLASEALKLTQENIRKSAREIIAQKCNSAIEKSAAKGLYQAQISITRNEQAFATYTTELLRQNGFVNVKYVAPGSDMRGEKWDGHITFSWKPQA